MSQPPENLIAKFIANRVGRDYEHIDVQLACSLMDYLKENGYEVVEVPEVEVTTSPSSRELVAVPEMPVERRRSGAKNLSDPKYQSAFVDEARAAMGQPSVEDAKALVGYTVTLRFNVDWPLVTGVLTEVIEKWPAPYLCLDDNWERAYPLNAIQEVVKVR